MQSVQYSKKPYKCRRGLELLLEINKKLLHLVQLHSLKKHQIIQLIKKHIYKIKIALYL